MESLCMVYSSMPICDSLMVCQYKDYGCKDYFCTYDKLLHERICPFRTVICPKCKWEGPYNYLKPHLLAQFLNDGEYVPFCLDDSGMKIVKSNDEVYVLVYEYIIQSNITAFNLRFLGPLEYSKRRYFKLRIKYSNGKIVEFCGQVADATSWDLQMDCAVSVNANCIKINPKHEKKVVSVGVKVEHRIPEFPKDIQKSLSIDISCRDCEKVSKGFMFQKSYGYSVCLECKGNNKIRNIALEYLCNNLIIAESGEFNEEVLFKSIECPVCLDYMFPPIKNCNNGHSICSFCRSRLSTCPMCKDNFNFIRNFSLESVCNKMHYKCIYDNYGCTYTNVLELLLFHEHDCQFANIFCLLKNV